MKKYLIISLLALVFLVTMGMAATTDFTANADITISAVTFGDSTADMLILDTSTAESWDYAAGAFTVTNPGTFKVGSGASESTVKTIRMTQGGSTVACAINTTPGTSYVTAPTTAATYTVVPSALTTCQDVCTVVSNAATLNSYPTCGAATCNSGFRLSGSGTTATCDIAPSSSSGGSSGSGGGSTPPPAPILPVPAAVPPPPAGGPPAAFVAQPSPVAQIVSPVFNRTLRLGAMGKDVKRLQQFLNSDLETLVTETGNGSPGQETDFFGNLTKRAVGKFQFKYAVIASESDDGYGIVGPRTRAKLAEVFSGQPAAAPIAESQTVAVLQAELRQLLEQLVILLQAQLQSLTFQ